MKHSKSTKTSSVKQRKPNRSKIQNRLWRLLGCIILILILIYWIFFIAIDYGPDQ